MATTAGRRSVPDTLVLVLTAVAWLVGGPAGAGAQAPACGTVTDGLPRALPGLGALPAVGQSYLDPVFGCAVTRLSNAAAEGAGQVTHFYSSVNPFNADSTLVLVQKAGGVQHIRDLSGQIVRDNLGRFGLQPLSEAFWSRTDPNLLYFHPVGGNQLRSYNVTTDTMQVLHTFGQYTSIWFGHWESDLSWDGDHLAILGDDRYGLIYTISTGAVTQAQDLLGVTGGVAVDVFDLTPSQGALVRWGNVNGGVGYFDQSMNFLGKIADYAGHSDRARDADGADLEVAVNAADLTPPLGCANAIVKIRLADRTETCLRPMDWSMAQHVSCNNVGQGWCLVSTYLGVPGTAAYANELFQVKLDGSVTIRLAHSRSTNADYDHYPRAAVSGDGQYVLFDSDMGGAVVDVYLLHVGAPGDTTPPTVAITAPPASSTVSGSVAVSGTASDDVGVAGVQFKLDGANLGTERTAAPYAVTWNTVGAANGAHTLTAVARDGAGNRTTSAGVVVTVNNADTTPPVVSGVTASSITASGATVTWVTNEASDSQVEYGLTTAYGSSTPVNSSLVTSHAQGLSGLTAGTLYHYRIKSRDATGNLATSGDFTFASLSAPDITSGLIGHWALDEDSGVTATDASGSGNPGALVNGPTWGPGRILGALTFDGTDDYVDVSTSAGLNAYPVTLSAWIKTGASTGTRGIINKYVAGSSNGFNLFLNSGTLCAWYFKDATNFVYDGTGCTLGVGGYNDNQWHHVAFVVDAAGGRLYVDGVQRTSRPWTGVPGAPSSPQSLSLGRYPGASEPSFVGTIDDVRIYNRALTTIDVAQLYGGGGSVADTTPPVISAVAVSSITASGAAITWVTNETSDTQVEYGLTATYGRSTPLNGSLVTSHSQVLSGLTADTVYHYRVKSRDAVGNLATSADFTFTTSPAGTSPASTKRKARGWFDSVIKDLGKLF